VSNTTWIGLGIGAALAATIGLAYWALKGGPPSSVATTTAAPGPAANAGTEVPTVDPSRGPAQSPSESGQKVADWFSQGITYLEGAFG